MRVLSLRFLVALALAPIGLGAAVTNATAGAFDLSLVAGVAQTDHVRKLGVVAGWSSGEPLWQGEEWRLALRHEVELAVWRAPRARDLVEFGYAPVFRLERPLGSAGALFFIEGSIGVHVLSHRSVSPARRFGSAWNFSDVLGLGWQFGEGGRHTVGLRLQHLSNGGIKKPNPGINFGQVYYRVRF